jgi:hypothetical protein
LRSCNPTRWAVAEVALKLLAPYALESADALAEGQLLARLNHPHIVRVFAFGETIATVHSHNRTHDWKPGQQTDFDVFMNLHTLDGRGVVCDIGLPGLPVGRDDTSLYVVDYGASGRRRFGTEPVTLVRVPVADAGSTIRAN